jgi:hypothetical protein
MATKLHGIEIEEDLAQAMRLAIDWQILSDLMISIGWTKVDVPSGLTLDQNREIQQWIKKHCRGRTKFGYETWLFEDPKDAMWFTLKWGH